MLRAVALVSDGLQVTPKYINSLVELITSNIDSIHGADVHPSSGAPPGLVDGVHTPEMIVRVSASHDETELTWLAFP